MRKGSRVMFYTGVGTVTGANFLVESAAGVRVVIDCGLVQGERVALAENYEKFPYDLSSISALVITHAHLDHVGRIPKFVKDGYRGPIFSTPETRALAELVLNDAVGIMINESRQDGREPLYSLDDVRNIFGQWRTLPYHESVQIGPDVSILLKDAGHILGSAMIEVTTNSGVNINENALKILFTGDLGNSPAPLLRDTEPVGEADYLIMESVYGDRNHETREGRVNKLQQIINESIARGGTLVIPTFAIDRTQILLYELNNLVERQKIPSVPVFVDSPMAIRATEIYSGSQELFNDQAREQISRGDDLFRFSHLKYTMSQDQSRDIENIKGAKIILAGSGMSVGGRVIGHELRYLPDPKNTILLVGYQAAGSLGRELADGAKKVRIHKEHIKVKAKIETLYGFSAHKDGDHLLEFVSTGSQKLKEVFVVMGEPGASMHLAQRINDELGVKAIVPERSREYRLGEMAQ